MSLVSLSLKNLLRHDNGMRLVMQGSKMVEIKQRVGDFNNNNQRYSNSQPTSSYIGNNNNLKNDDKQQYIDVIPRNSLSRLQKRSSTIHSDLRAQTLNRYQNKFEKLNAEQERTAGKFSHLGKRLGSIRELLSNKLNREPTDEE